MVNRCRRKWTVPEILALQREFELLHWSIDEIAKKHHRTIEAIMYKLDQEGFADFNVLYSNYYDLNSPIPVTRTNRVSTLDTKGLEEEEDEIKDDDYFVERVNKEELDALAQRVAALELKLATMQSNLMK